MASNGTRLSILTTLSWGLDEDGIGSTLMSFFCHSKQGSSVTEIQKEWNILDCYEYKKGMVSKWFMVKSNVCQGCGMFVSLQKKSM